MGPYPACHRLWGSVSVLMGGTPCSHCLVFPLFAREYRAAGNVEHQLDERPGSSLCAGQQPRWTSWCSSFPGPCPVVLPSWERRAPARWAARFKPLCWPAASLDELVLVPPRVTPDYAIRVIALRKRSNEPANITAPIRARARKGFQTVSSPAPR